ncbi:hypothetical protein QUF72_06450 [Desulfobacterales bacterium HSG2]|nr:hypothetical protein [Desulfobacterales bacterium HSG2]
MTTQINGNIKTEYDRKLDLFTAYIKEDKGNPIETIPGPFDGHVLFEVDSADGDLVRIVIYDFSVIRRELMKEMVFLLTKKRVPELVESAYKCFSGGQRLCSEAFMNSGCIWKLT